jgi:DNA-binding NarL/FixJ family response regulator
MSTAAPVRVLVADDHTVVRQGIVNMLNSSEEVEVVAEASDGAEAMRQALETRPDVAVLDVSMPRLNGIEAARRIHEALPLTRILVLTMHDEEEYVVRMIRAGASGYILKDGVVSELIAGILAVSKGKPYFAPETIAVRARRAAEAPPSKEDDPYESLTDRERDVFHLIVEGKTNAGIAAVLAISPKTVDNHRTRLMEKLSLHSAAELVLYAAKNRLIP